MTTQFVDSTVIVAAKQQVSTDLGQEVAILGLTHGVYYGLDGVGAELWKLIQQPRRFEEIRTVLAGHYDVAVDRLDLDLRDLLADMLARELIEVS
jgi:hypothetical protein